MNSELSSVFHQPQPPSSCWKSASRSSPARIFFSRSSGLMFVLSPSCFTACDTTTFGRKLDMVCSVHPYGKLIRYSSALNIVPATDGVTESTSLRDDAAASDG